MPKPKSAKQQAPVKTEHRSRYKLHGPENYCRYCCVKLPRGSRRFCNDKHKAAFSG